MGTETRVDFLECLEPDMSLHILSFLDEPADVVRASAVSHFWRHLVIANGVSKQLCLRKFPEFSNVESIVKTNEDVMESGTNSTEWKSLERNHEGYASLLQALTKSKVSSKDCIENAFSASSTDRYPDESVVNTLNPRDRFIRRASYWSSEGHTDPDAPEKLTYKLRDGIWLLTEVDIQPFEAFFQPGRPIYSAKFVRFRMGYPKSQRAIEKDLVHLPLQKSVDNKFVWTYTSPEFPMTQENRLQPFKLPEPVLCIGGYLQIELLGRVQTQETDGLFYTCVCYVRVLGRPLFPAFDIQILESHGTFLLKYNPGAVSWLLKNSSNDKIPYLRQLEEQMLWDRVGLLKNLLRGIQEGPNGDMIWDDDDDLIGLDENDGVHEDTLL